VNDVNVPTHKVHLQTKNSRVATLVGQQELDGITIRNPDKTLTKDIVSDFIYTVIACKAFTQMRMQPNFVPAALLSPKSNRMEDSCRTLGHERETFTVLIIPRCVN
jgi:hypothetical protein